MENFSNFVAFSQYPNFKTQMHKNQNAHLENSSTHYEKAGPRGTTNFQKSFKWKYGIFGTEKTNSGSSSMTSHHYANYLGGPGRNKVIISIYSIRVFFFEKGKPVMIFMVSPLSKFPISDMIIGALINDVRFIVCLSKIAEIL